MFSPFGCVGRALFWQAVLANVVLPPVLGFALGLALLPMGVAAGFAQLLVGAISIYSLLCVFAKRLHDAGHSGWWAVLAVGAGVVAVFLLAGAVLGHWISVAGGSFGGAFYLGALLWLVWAGPWLAIALPVGMLSRDPSAMDDERWIFKSPSAP